MSKATYEEICDSIQPLVDVVENGLNDRQMLAFILYVLPRCLHHLGKEQTLKLLELAELDGVGNCPDGCPICSPESYKPTRESIREDMKKVGLIDDVLDSKEIE